MYTVGDIFGRDIWGYKREWGTDVFDMVRWSGWTDVSQLQCDPRRVKPWYFFIGGSPVELAPGCALLATRERERERERAFIQEGNRAPVTKQTTYSALSRKDCGVPASDYCSDADKTVNLWG
jgi:hypothetical protein